jgi:hypothetical protein
VIIFSFENFFSIAKKVFKLSKKCSWSSVGRCPTPYPLFEKSGAKTFMCGFATGGS